MSGLKAAQEGDVVMTLGRSEVAVLASALDCLILQMPLRTNVSDLEWIEELGALRQKLCGYLTALGD